MFNKHLIHPTIKPLMVYGCLISLSFIFSFNFFALSLTSLCGISIQSFLLMTWFFCVCVTLYCSLLMRISPKLATYRHSMLGNLVELENSP